MKTHQQFLGKLVLSPKRIEAKANIPHDKYFKKIVIFFFSFCILLSICYSQTPSSNQIEELGSKLSVMNASANPTINIEAKSLESLVYDLKSTMYLKSGQFTDTAATHPIRVNTDAQSFSLLQYPTLLYNNVELICIKIMTPEDLQKVLSVSDLSWFNKLKYICFLADFKICSEQTTHVVDCEKNKIANMIQGTLNPGLEVIYVSGNIE